MIRPGFLALLLASALAGCSRSDAAVSAPLLAVPGTQAPTSAGTRAVGRPRLVFFMNPSGAPCQMQDQILRAMGAELAARADVVYYRTTSSSDLSQFQAYGIRSLPTLLVTDANGAELRRATPGIQPAAQVRALLGG